MLYVRQSSPAQVLRNEESRRLQYGMRKRLMDLGWRDIEVVDQDLGKSAEGHVERTGFERMVAEVCMGKVGAVAAREVSRFARNSREWQQLIEVCRVVDTLLVDHETVYDPRRGNDRLLLGLKGSLNEYELDVLRLRSLEARYAKARRGELIVQVPVGFVKTSDGRMEKDPDLRVREAVALVFRKTLSLGAARQTLLWLIENGIDLPARRRGPLGWEVVWRRPTYAAVMSILRNPAYAGMYAYGKTEAVVELEGGRARKRARRKPASRWLCLMPDRHEGYIGREEFERIQEMMLKNAQAYCGGAPGAAKRGPALLVGVLRCRRCGRKLLVKYTGARHDVPRYHCTRGALDHAEPRCIEFGGLDADEAVSRELARVVEPGAVEAARLAAEEADRKEDDAARALLLELDAARYAAEKAFRQYDATDPANRLVAGELERRWNAALEKVRELEARVDAARARREGALPPNADALGNLAADLDAVWRDPATDARLRKRILRALVEEVVADVDARAGQVTLVVHWKGGVHTELSFRRRRRGESRTSAAPEAVDAVRGLALVCTDTVIAGYLNRNGLRTGKGNRWTREKVTSLRSKRGIAVYSVARRRAEGWMTLKEAAAELGLCEATLKRAAERGNVKALHPLPEGPWVLNRADLSSAGALEVVERVEEWRRTGRKRTPGQLTLTGSGT